MPDGNSISRTLRNAFQFLKGRPSGMSTDTHISDQPDNTYRYGIGVRSGSSHERSGGLFNAQGMNLESNLPEGYTKRGHHFLEETDRHIFALFNEGADKSEVGYVNAKTGVYTPWLNDDDIEGGKLGFGMHEWITFVSKFMKNSSCFEVHVYWTNGSYYKTLNMDRIIKPIRYFDILLLHPRAVAAPILNVAKTGGSRMQAGVYYIFAQLADNDNNTTNFFEIQGPVSLESPNNIPGEDSENCIHIRIDNLNREYHKVNIAAVKIIDGAISQWMIAELYYSSDHIEFVYRSQEQEIRPVDMEDILTKNNGYFRGYDLFQYDGRLFPYNLIAEPNPDLQKHIDAMEIGYVIEQWPVELAYLAEGMRGDEVYEIGIKENYIDGTYSGTFHKKGREANRSDLEMIPPGDDNCLSCEVPAWKVRNTAIRTQTLCNDPDEQGDLQEEIVYQPGVPTYTETPKPSEPIKNEDGAGIPNEDTIKNADKQKQQAMECMCKRLAPVFWLYEAYYGQGFVDPIPFPTMHKEMMSDPVAIVTAWCGCEELTNNGGADDTEADDGDFDCSQCDCDGLEGGSGAGGGADIEIRSGGEGEGDGTALNCEDCCKDGS